MWENKANAGTLLQKSIFCPKIQFSQIPTFSRVFHPKFIWQFFSWNQSCQQLKSPKPQHFHEFFTQFFLTIFLVKSKLSTAKKTKTTTFSPKKNRQFSREIIVDFLDRKWRFCKNSNFLNDISETFWVISKHCVSFFFHFGTVGHLVLYRKMTK